MNKRTCDITGVTPKSTHEIECIAEDFLSKYNHRCLNNPTRVDMINVLDPYMEKNLAFSFDVRDDAAVPASVFAFTDFLRKEIVFSESTYDRLEKKHGVAVFTAAHELGHVLTIRDELRNRIERFYSGEDATLDPWMLPRRRGEIRNYACPEWQANACAAAILMPRRTIWEVIDSAVCEFSLENLLSKDNELKLARFVVKKVKSTYGVSYSAAKLRIHKIVKHKFTPQRYAQHEILSRANLAKFILLVRSKSWKAMD